MNINEIFVTEVFDFCLTTDNTVLVLQIDAEVGFITINYVTTGADTGFAVGGGANS